MTLINLCSHERLEVFPGHTLTVVVYSEHNPQASIIHLNGGGLTIRQAACQLKEDNYGPS